MSDRSIQQTRSDEAPALENESFVLKPSVLPPPCLNSSYPEPNRSCDSPTPALSRCPKGRGSNSFLCPVYSANLRRESTPRSESVRILTLDIDTWYWLPRLLAFLFCCHSAVSWHLFIGQQTIIFYMLQFTNILMSLQGSPQNSHLFEKRGLMEYILAFFFFFSTVLHFIYFLKQLYFVLGFNQLTVLW